MKYKKIIIKRQPKRKSIGKKTRTINNYFLINDFVFNNTKDTNPIKKEHDLKKKIIT